MIDLRETIDGSPVIVKIVRVSRKTPWSPSPKTSETYFCKLWVGWLSMVGSSGASRVSDVPDCCQVSIT